MDIRGGKLNAGFTLDGHMTLTLEVADSSMEAVKAQFDRLFGKELDIKIVRHSEKRSLGANALMWKCLGELADTLSKDQIRVTNEELYLKMLEQYGRFIFMVVAPCAVQETKSLFRIVEEFSTVKVNGQTGVQLKCFPGSSTYKVDAMTRLLNGVIGECKDAGAWVPDEQDVGASIDIWRREHDRE